MLAKYPGLSALILIVTLAQAGEARAQDDAGCNAMPLQTKQARCFIAAVKASGNIDTCEAATDPVVRLHCLSRYAEHIQDPAPCARIATEEPESLTLRDSCIAGVAVAARNPELCSAAELADLRNACYMLLVMDHDADPAYCARIDSDVLKDACRGTAE